jgi:hypothetical protein
MEEIKEILAYLKGAVRFLPPEVIVWWRAHSADLLFYLWAAAGVAIAYATAYAFYRLWRWSRGDRKFRGTWYREKQWVELLVMLAEDQNSGRRVMQRDEIALLRKLYGAKSAGFDLGSGYR